MEDIDTTQGVNPDGEKYTLGECQCGSKSIEALAEVLVDWTAMGLDGGFEALGSITCGMLFNMVKEMVEVGMLFIRGAGQVASAAKTVTRAAKMVAKQTDGKSKWNQFVRDTSSADDESHKEDVVKAFDIMEKGVCNFLTPC